MHNIFRTFAKDSLYNDEWEAVTISMFWLCPCDLVVHDRSQVPIKVNKTNYYVFIHACFLSCCKFRGRAVSPTLCLMFDCMSCSSSDNLPVCRSTPGSKVITTEPLSCALWYRCTHSLWFRCTHSFTHNTHKTNSSTLVPCAVVCSLSRRWQHVRNDKARGLCGADPRSFNVPSC